VAGSQDSLYYVDKVFKPYPININFNFRAVDLLVKDSLLIATTSEKGVFFIQDSIVKKNLNSSNGFSSNTCYKSVLYKNVLYTATNKGINIYDFKTDSVFHLYESDGLPSNTVFDLSVYNDTLYAATESGLSVVPISVIPHQRTFHFFASPVIANRDTFWNEPAQIEVYDNEPITIVLNALSYGTKSPVTYYFKIAGIDTAYRFTSDPELHLNNLSHGNYTLQSYAMNTDDVVSNPIAIVLQVKPFFYQTLTFRILFVTGILLIFLLFVIWMKKAIEKRELLKSEGERRIRTLELAAWKAAFNPHFLFNSIQTLQSLFLDKDFDSANKFAAKFSAILRKTVDHSSQLFISIADEISYLQNYLELEKIKREGKLKYDIISDELCDILFVPSLVLQVVVENSLKHGIQERSDGYISIKFVCANDRVTCTIVDNGAGFNENDAGKSTSKGIQLLRNKLSSVEKILNQTIQFSFKNRLSIEGEVIGVETFFSFPKIQTIHEISGNPG
ncbi:MAG: histidine kinase, partial [Chitinophagaceae bacterium]|nr:histidine kinase [Chitinophagaceae bacterium]